MYFYIKRSWRYDPFLNYINTVVSVQIFLLLSSQKLILSFIVSWVLFLSRGMNCSWPLGGRAPCLFVIQFAFLFIKTFYLRSWNHSFGLLCDLIWGTALCAFFCEDECRTWWCILGFHGESYYCFPGKTEEPKMRWRVEQRKSSTSASINLWASYSVQTVLSSFIPCIL